MLEHMLQIMPFCVAMQRYTVAMDTGFGAIGTQQLLSNSFCQSDYASILATSVKDPLSQPRPVDLCLGNIHYESPLRNIMGDFERQ